MGYDAQFDPRFVMQSKAVDDTGTGFIVADDFNLATITAQTGHDLVEPTHSRDVIAEGGWS